MRKSTENKLFRNDRIYIERKDHDYALMSNGHWIVRINPLFLSTERQKLVNDTKIGEKLTINGSISRDTNTIIETGIPKEVGKKLEITDNLKAKVGSGVFARVLASEDGTFTVHVDEHYLNLILEAVPVDKIYATYGEHGPVKFVDRNDNLMAVLMPMRK